jgi:DNA integrity scanning protein DisA with diadenylate cyclase activity
LKSLILALQFKFVKLFDFIIEDDLANSDISGHSKPYLNIYMVRLASENADNSMISLVEFKQTYRDVMEVQQRVELLRRICRKIDDYH